jgi:hypothetical protein
LLRFCCAAVQAAWSWLRCCSDCSHAVHVLQTIRCAKPM